LIIECIGPLLFALEVCAQLGDPRVLGLVGLDERGGGRLGLAGPRLRRSPLDRQRDEATDRARAGERDRDDGGLDHLAAPTSLSTPSPIALSFLLWLWCSSSEATVPTNSHRAS